MSGSEDSGGGEGKVDSSTSSDLGPSEVHEDPGHATDEESDYVFAEGEDVLLQLDEYQRDIPAHVIRRKLTGSDDTLLYDVAYLVVKENVPADKLRSIP